MTPTPQATPLYEHPDGGLYVRVETSLIAEVKMDDGRWEPAVIYRPVIRNGERLSFASRRIFTTTAARWAERFTEIPR